MSTNSAGTASAGFSADAWLTWVGDKLASLSDTPWKQGVLGVLALGAVYHWRSGVDLRKRQRAIEELKTDLSDEEMRVVQFIFHSFNASGALALDRRSFKAFVDAGGRGASAAEIRTHLGSFYLFDLDGDGMLSLPEFALYFKAIKNMAGGDIVTQLLQHYVDVITAIRDGKGLPSADASGEAPLGGGAASLGGGGPSGPGSAASARAARRTFKPSNEHETAIMSDVISPEDIGVSFESIGALDHVKRTLTELVIAPLRHPKLFSKGQLSKPLKGVLLFGPPGTGKTLLAKAVATESGASFLNISASSLGSKWYGESEKLVKAMFTVARKMAPTVIFIDEIDSLLQSREGGNSSTLRSVQTVLMTEWDGLATPNQRVVVLGATNVPWSLDEAILRRAPRRLLVDVPDRAARANILLKMLKDDELADDVDVDVIAEKADGFTGSDLQNLCRETAFIRVRERIAEMESFESKVSGKGTADKKEGDKGKGKSTGKAEDKGKGKKGDGDAAADSGGADESKESDKGKGSSSQESKSTDEDSKKAKAPRKLADATASVSELLGMRGDFKSAVRTESDDAVDAAAAGAEAARGKAQALMDAAKLTAKRRELEDKPLRPISANDFVVALKRCRASGGADSAMATRNREWDREFGDFGEKSARKGFNSMYV